MSDLIEAVYTGECPCGANVEVRLELTEEAGLAHCPPKFMDPCQVCGDPLVYRRTVPAPPLGETEEGTT